MSLPKLRPSSIPMKAPGAFSAPLMNLRAELSTELPMPGAPLVTYAYPENAILDFNMGGEIPEIRGDYFEGGFLRFVSVPEHPFLARAQNFVVSSPRLFRPS